MIERNKYLDKLIKSINNGFPKVITGVRRCGKSYLLTDIFVKYLKKQEIKEEEIVIVDLDKDVNASLRNPIKLGKYVRSLTKENKRYYVIIDEIQRVSTIVNPEFTNGKIVLAKEGDTEVISFVDVVLGLSHEKNIDLYVTGSNSKMLSTDIVTEFRDKATNIHIAPLSYEEYYNYIGGSKSDVLYAFIQYGGMPLAVLKDEEDRKKYLIELFETTYFKDIIEHNKLNKSESLDELCDIISNCVGGLLNAEKISNTFESVKHEKIHRQTVDKYLQYFIDAFLVKEVKRYDLRGRKEIGALKKYYFVDTGLRNARLNFAYPDEGQLLENVIYNELLYNGYTVNVGTFDNVEKEEDGTSIRKTLEIDFYARKNNRMYYIQVTDNINDAKTRAREIKPFIQLNDSIQKIIVINKPINECREDNGFTIIGATDFMLRFIK